MYRGGIVDVLDRRSLIRTARQKGKRKPTQEVFGHTEGGHTKQDAGDRLRWRQMIC